MCKVAIVILNWNGCGLLRRFLPPVIEESGGNGVSVFVADNASSDSSVAMLRKEFPSVTLIPLDRNYGYAGGYNEALQQIDAEYAVLLNSDIEVTPGWLSPLVDFMDNHPQAAACQPKIRSWHDRECFEHAGACGGFIDKYGYPFCRGRILTQTEEDRGQYDTEVPVFWASGAALFIRLKAYRDAGGLDERFFAHMEEIDLCWRWRARGFSIACIPQSVVYHVGAGTLKKENPRKTFLNFRNNLLMLYKNLPRKDLRPVLRMRIFLDYLAALHFLLRGKFCHAAAVYNARREFGKVRSIFEEDRALNLKKTTQGELPGKMNKSVLWEYYIRRRKRYSQLLFK